MTWRRISRRRCVCFMPLVFQSKFRDATTNSECIFARAAHECVDTCLPTGRTHTHRNEGACLTSSGEQTRSACASSVRMRRNSQAQTVSRKVTSAVRAGCAQSFPMHSIWCTTFFCISRDTFWWLCVHTHTVCSHANKRMYVKRGKQCGMKMKHICREPPRAQRHILNIIVANI